MPLKNWFIHPRGKPLPRLVLLWNLLLVSLAISALFFYVFQETAYDFHWSGVWEYRQKFIDGFGVTIVISLFALVLSILIGGVIAFGQQSSLILYRLFCKFYIETVRGTPLLVQILLFFYVFATAFGFENRYAVGIVIMALFSGAYVSEIIRAGIESIGKDQHEAALALNFSTYQKYRYVILPQAIRRIMPPLAGQFANLIKDSSLLSIISIREFTMNAQEVNAYTYSTLESYIPLAIGYLLLTYPISLYSKHLENKHRY